VAWRDPYGPGTPYDSAHLTDGKRAHRGGPLLCADH